MDGHFSVKQKNEFIFIFFALSHCLSHIVENKTFRKIREKLLFQTVTLLLNFSYFKIIRLQKNPQNWFIWKLFLMVQDMFFRSETANLNNWPGLPDKLQHNSDFFVWRSTIKQTVFRRVLIVKISLTISIQYGINKYMGQGSGCKDIYNRLVWT